MPDLLSLDYSESIGVLESISLWVVMSGRALSLRAAGEILVLLGYTLGRLDLNLLCYWAPSVLFAYSLGV